MPDENPWDELRPEEQAAIAEFRRKPVGQHSPFLQQRINIMRGEPVEGKYVLLCTRPHREWVLAQMNGRAKPLTIHSNVVFHDLVEAEYEIFRLRWERHFGKKIPQDLLPGIGSRR
jgi:hypothetical protein